jgi:hypothetical protein
MGISGFSYSGLGQYVLFAAGTFIEVNVAYWPAFFRYVNFASMYYPLIAVPTLLYLYFAFNIFKYFRGECSRLRSMVFGLAAVVVTPLTSSVVSLYGVLTIPLPFTLVIGLVVLFALPQLRSAEAIWEDTTKSERWFEGTHESAQDRIKVPFTSRLRSKLKGTPDGQDSQEWDRKEEDVFGSDS